MAVSGVGAVPLTADPLQADPNSFGAAMQQEIAAASNEPTVPAPAPQAAPSSAPAEAVPTPQAPAAEQAPNLLIYRLGIRASRVALLVPACCNPCRMPQSKIVNWQRA
jgi:hypothetical protein